MTTRSARYLPAFEAGVKDGLATCVIFLARPPPRPLSHRRHLFARSLPTIRCVMCSYNAETYGDGLFGNGTASQSGAIPSCANHGILNGLLRDEWGFDGRVGLFSVTPPPPPPGARALVIAAARSLARFYSSIRSRRRRCRPTARTLSSTALSHSSRAIRRRPRIPLAVAPTLSDRSPFTTPALPPHPRARPPQLHYV